jgi:UDP-GlcNAc:undecaprenyl-phosphate GlcNAc-1-phosphate transferase
MFSLPVLDTALAFARRKMAGRPLFSPDKQHLHHQLIARGLSVKQAVLVAYGLAIFFVLCGVAIVYIRTRFAVAFYLVLFGSIVVAAYKMGMVHERVVNAPRAEMGGTGIIEVPPGEDNTPIG